MKIKMPVLPSQPLPFLRRQSILHLCLQLGAVSCLPAFAAEGDVFQPYVGYSFAYDENVSGIKDADNPDNRKLSDTSRRAEAGLAVKKRISQQVLSAKLNVAHVTYDEFDTLNNDSKDLLGNWNWHVGDRVEGNLGASYVQELSSVTNSGGVDARNLRTQRREFFDGSWLLHPSWRVRGGLSRDKLSYDVDAADDRNENASELGLDYLARSGSTVGMRLRHTRGDLPNQPSGDNNYDQNELKAKVDWLLTGKTQLQFLGGYVQRKYGSDSARDYSGLNARVIANWKPTGQLGVTVSGWREIGAPANLTTEYGEFIPPVGSSSSFTLNQGVSIGSTWDVTSKIRLAALLKHETNDFRGAEAGREDTYRTASAKLTYRATNHLQLATLLYRNSIPGDSTANNGVMLSSRYEF